MNPICDSAGAKIDIFVVLTTPTFCCQSPVRHLVRLSYLPLSTQSHTKSFRYAGGCLVRCPHSKEGGVIAGGDGVVTGGGSVLTGGLLRSTGGFTGLLATGVSSLISPDGAPPWGVLHFRIRPRFRK